MSTEVESKLKEALITASFRLLEYRKRCGCRSMAGICFKCQTTLGVEAMCEAALSAYLHEVEKIRGPA